MKHRKPDGFYAFCLVLRPNGDGLAVLGMFLKLLKINGYTYMSPANVCINGDLSKWNIFSPTIYNIVYQLGVLRALITKEETLKQPVKLNALLAGSEEQLSIT